MTNTHSFHIPVMGIAFTIDTPLKVSQYGIDSVISLVDDILIEKLRKFYCVKYSFPYTEISEKIADFRAKRITSYLNLINKLAEKKFEEFKNAAINETGKLKEYFDLLPDNSKLKEEFNNLTSKFINIDEIKNWVKENLTMGSIDVNIMTKVDKDNYLNDEKLPVEYNDAHAALRGYANSNLKSSVILSAGMNPRLYSYIEQFPDFYPDENGEIRKKIILKVSDYRSALIQGKFLAKKGLWVSEYRVESGLNCGGHAFATDGYLLGPILAEFRDNKEKLIEEVYEILKQSLLHKSRVVPKNKLPLNISAQGGVGTHEEHEFLLDHYKLDSVGWGTPFLLVSEATTVDDATLEKLTAAKESDLYLSNISPLGVPFNNMKGNTQDTYKLAKIAKGNPGSACSKKYVALNTELTERAICTASRKYQFLKLKELNEKQLPFEQYQAEFDKIVEKSCICVGLGTSALLKYNLDIKKGGDGVSVCPGPNLAYFSRKISLKEMIDHINGKINVITRTDRPNMFVKELSLYIEYLKNQILETTNNITTKQKNYLSKFAKNLCEGINYYQNLFNNMAKESFEEIKSGVLNDLENNRQALRLLTIEIEKLN
ncbi:hypothetical protein [Abyssalbus ytuae]|uniref:Uncharacterized protein n=1 Tax=Abyssalbus ytuae TaxID=2926907 RepID=A0A9E6ZR17_9FLAO|nr:hypothetical protein [Abyssalbus ytuae]UOB16318.1 hypothetical protein MQE35_11275 [Abyssalbus ytuae]